MNPEIKKKWIEDLETTTEEQGTERLHTIDEFGNHYFCCLGRLCEVMGVESHYDSVSEQAYLYDGDDGLLSDNLLKQSGLSKSHQGVLCALNDGQTLSREELEMFPDLTYAPTQLSFKEIAAFLKKHDEI